MILKESTKLVYKNIKMMLLVTTLSLVLSSIFFLIFDFSSFSLFRDMLARESLIPISSSNSSELASHLSEINENFLHVLTFYLSFVLSYFIVNLLPTIAAVIVSSEYYKSTNLSLKELSSRIAKSCMRACQTGFYTTIFVIGYVFLVISMATPLLAYSKLLSILVYVILFGVFAYIFYLYLSSVWIMSLVVSIIDEESCGTEALGKSAVIMKGQKWNGFLLNIVLNLVSLGVYLGSKMVRSEKICGLVLVNGSCLVRIVTFVMYTVVYYRDKERYGQEIELNGSSNIEYAKLDISPLAGVP